MTRSIISNRKYHRDWVEFHYPDMIENFLLATQPKVVYFPFWSWKVPKEILDKYVCVGFHTGGLTGGSPIQHSIKNGDKESYISVFRMTEDIDKGIVFTSRNIKLHGTLEEILIRMSKTIMELIDGFEKNNEQSFIPKS